MKDHEGSQLSDERRRAACRPAAGSRRDVNVPTKNRPSEELLSAEVGFLSACSHHTDARRNDGHEHFMDLHDLHGE